LAIGVRVGSPSSPITPGSEPPLTKLLGRQRQAKPSPEDPGEDDLKPAQVPIDELACLQTPVVVDERTCGIALTIDIHGRQNMGELRWKTDQEDLWPSTGPHGYSPPPLS
jgi:hypothetical protein